MRVTIKRGWLEISEVGAEAPEEEEREGPLPAALPAPYFDIGEARGKAGETVSLRVEGGCRFPITGLHIGGGCGKLDEERPGYGLFEVVGAKLGDFLRAYLRAEDMIHDEPMHQHDHFWSVFQMAKGEPDKALPEEWWDFALGFFSLDERNQASPTTIPSGTELFTLEVKILPDTAPGEYEVTCLDEHYYTQSQRHRRDFMYTADRDSEFARGGVTKLKLHGGKITVTA